MKYADYHSTGEARQRKSKANQPLTILEAYKRLSRRECEVLLKIAEGKTSQEIVDELFISSKKS